MVGPAVACSNRSLVSNKFLLLGLCMYCRSYNCTIKAVGAPLGPTYIALPKGIPLTLPHPYDTRYVYTWYFMTYHLYQRYQHCWCMAASQQAYFVYKKWYDEYNTTTTVTTVLSWSLSTFNLLYAMFLLSLVGVDDFIVRALLMCPSIFWLLIQYAQIVGFGKAVFHFPIGIQLDPIANWIPIGFQLPTGNPLESYWKVETNCFPISNWTLCTSWYIFLRDKWCNPIGNWKSVGIQFEIGNPLESNWKLESNWIPIEEIGFDVCESGNRLRRANTT